MHNTHTKKAEEQPIAREQYLRFAADFENYRKRMEGPDGAVVHATEAGKEAVLKDMLDIVDLFERAQAHEELSEGVTLALQELLHALQKYGVERMEVKDMPFDPAEMEAVGAVSGGTSGHIQSVQRTGWKIHDRILRPARVIVYQ